MAGEPGPAAAYGQSRQQPGRNRKNQWKCGLKIEDFGLQKGKERGKMNIKVVRQCRGTGVLPPDVGNTLVMSHGKTGVVRNERLPDICQV